MILMKMIHLKPQNMTILDHLLVLLSVASLCSFPQISASFSPISEISCPFDFKYVMKLPWDSSSCQQDNIRNSEELGETSNCCQTLTSLYGVAFAEYLKKTSLFRLPNLETSISCLLGFQEILSFLKLPENLTSLCFQASQFVNTTDVCARIQTEDDWLSVLGTDMSLETGCKQDLADLTACDSCVIAGFKVLAKLIGVDGNHTHSKGCFYYTILYAAGKVNKFGPMSNGALSCIFGLPLNSKRDTKKWALVFGSIGGGFAVISMACLISFVLPWRKMEKVSEIFSVLDQDLEENALLKWRPRSDSFWFSSEDLEKATNYFSSKNFIGQGRFGIVYKGKLPDGTMIAVKKIVDSDFQGDFEFYREVEIISVLKHRNLVPLRGCSVSSGDTYSERESHKYLVYDYMPNGNLNDHLFPLRKGEFRYGKKPMTWPQRKNIILDVANALAYLHYGVKPPIYHRDIKPTNILLDSCMRARVADFGLAKQGQESGSHFTTRIAGTHGYLAPEYAMYGQLTEKSDIYSFGMVILEIMCGRKALDMSKSTFLITDWVWPSVKDGKIHQVLDPALLEGEGYGEKKYPKVIMERFVKIGILCAHLMVAFRPNTLDALKMLEGDIEVPVIPDRPFYANNNMFNSTYKRDGM